ncbi:MAG TPA: HEAT repeat domain-containing protein [Candidatus Krumholzibacteria bacterium]|nr:HEAT repeat domain-containing protein [Candidatus Krumholzibacteria bacterium]
MMQALGWSLVHFVWQGAAIAMLLAVALRATSARAASLRYALCVAALAAMAVVPMWTACNVGGRGARAPFGLEPMRSSDTDRAGKARDESPNDIAQPPTTVATATDAPVRDAVITPAVVPAPATPAWQTLRGKVQRALPLLVAAWLAGVVVLSLRLLGGWLQTRRFRRIGVRPAPAACVAIVAKLAAKLGIRRGIEVLESTWMQVPGVIGWLRPVLLVPASALTGLDPRQLEMLLAHELAHVRRHDYLVNILQMLVETMLFYHPATWWVSRHMRAEREHCCDDVAIDLCGGDARLYARTLLELEELRAEPALAVAASGGVLAWRVRRLLAPSPREAPSHWTFGALGLATGIGLAAVLLLAPGVVPPTSGAPPDLGKSQSPVAQAPDPTAPLAARWDWALDQARARGVERFWIGYTIAPNPELEGPVFVGHLGEGEAALRGQDLAIAGRITHIGQHGDRDASWVFPGAILDVAGDQNAVALVYEIEQSGRKQTLLHVHAVSLVYPIDLQRRPLYWLGSSDDAASVAVLRKIESNARGLDARVDLTGALGVHAASALVVPPLIERVRSDGPDDVRTEAVEWLARHSRPESLATLTHAARRDRSANVRREAAGAVGTMRLAAAGDSASALARTLQDPDARREAVESLGERTDAKSLSTLIDIATRDPDSDIAREATETLGERAEPSARATLRDLARTHPDTNVRREAVETLGHVLPPEEARRELQDIALNNTSVDACREAVETLAQLPGGVGVKEVRELARTHSNSDVRREAIEELGHSLPGNDGIDELLRAAQSDASEDVQREAVETLGERDEARAHELVARLAREHVRAQVRREAVETVGAALPAADAVRVLTNIADNERDTDVVREALETLSELPNGAGIEPLVKIARTHEDAEIRREALKILVESDDPRARALFDRALQER